MKRLLNWKFLLILIILLAGFLRFYNLSSNPPSINWDETAWGYNAYSLGLDGKDEFGRFLPHDYLESFGDFKPPMYAYLDVIPVKLLGLNEFSTRFPSAFLGTLSVLFTFLLVRQIFYLSKKREYLALVTSFFLAISPWHIMLSRGAFEANVANFFIIIAVWSLLKSINEKPLYLYLSSMFFALSFYVFNTPRVVSPILVLVLAVIFRKKLLIFKKTTILAVILGLLIILPTFGFLLTPQAGLRFKEVNIFSDVNIVKTANQEILNDNNLVVSKLIHNRRILFATEYLKHYFDNLNPGFLFIKGDENTKFSTHNSGQMYLWDIVFFIIGILLLFKKKEGFWIIVPLWLLIGIIPAAFARETPHALRIESSLPMFQLITAYGFVYFLEFLKNKKLKLKSIKTSTYGLLSILLIVLLFGNFIYFVHDYFSNYGYRFSQDWQFGYKNAYSYIKNVENKYNSIVFTSSLGRPYIYFLFYNKINPVYFRTNSDISRDTFGFVSVERVGKYYFPKIINAKDKNVLYVVTPNEVPVNAKILKKFYSLNGNIQLVSFSL